ncbi:adenosylhomocysteine nucleosidase [Thermolongibacillus altinsuensis]|uniref:5'-methylthioadenosine/S-adenosylhomocysteine nucleosidase n=1 Tax=Thermolongibacillus altinsuensis TaxID=575256 RepID=A0A4R1QIW0_9BACL|nr:5'-methylthioadenosine/S-adenosylhomocysteine nucleosidase [Thermolongibacillus altinsuensis]TCL52004.1 adenosylhomocysteine nucleosidase [Thermolongibacillus altinsuensis]GMB07539.1 5'-methylthioadenosine/S-adenosylhomocysteine nucleosidase [Thermolongibacillus altinsuensis]
MKVAIIGAMEEEVAILREKIADRQETTIANCQFSTGTLDGVDVILLKSGIGKVNAAMSTTILLERFKPDVVINTGSAGGFLSSLNVGDIVISTEVVHHDVDVTAFGYAYGQVPGMPARYAADEKLIEIAEKSAEQIRDVQVAKGLIATGDSFMNDPARVEFVRKQIPELYAVEMEAAAIAQVCFQFGVPFVIIRALSDIAGKESNVSFEQFLHKAALHSSQLVQAMVNELKRS